VANTWIETMPCNSHLRRLSEKVKQGIRQAGGTPIEFNTVAISDGITMGTEGMKTSLISREVVADSIELVAMFEEEFGIEMDEDAALAVQTVGDAVTFIANVCKEQGVEIEE